jgi:hypothetical protein
MSEHDEKRGGSGCAIGLVLMLLFLPVLYVFSMGPVASLFYSGYISPNSFNAFYAPLLWLGEHVGFIDDAIRWYIDVWVPAAN